MAARTHHRQRSTLRSWLFHTYRPNAAFLLAAVFIYGLIRYEAPLVVWVIAGALLYLWLGLALRSFGFLPHAMIVDRAVPLFTLFLTRREIPYHDVLRARMHRFGPFWLTMEIITSRTSYHLSAWSLRANRRMLSDLKRYCPDKLKRLND